jgi:hypothetical protein
MQNTYNIFIEYFDNILLQKTNDEDYNSIYMVRISTLLQNTYQYIIVIVPKDVYEIGHLLNLSELKWNMLQTRTYKYKINCTEQSYRRKHEPKHIITKINKKNTEHEYSVENLPLKVILIDNPESMYEYPQKGTLSAALDTFQTIICFK